MATTEIYHDHTISWRETGERCAAIITPPSAAKATHVIAVSMSEGMAVLREQTYRAIDEGLGPPTSN